MRCFNYIMVTRIIFYNMLSLVRKYDLVTLIRFSVYLANIIYLIDKRFHTVVYEVYFLPEITIQSYCTLKIMTVDQQSINKQKI
jgi:hypothetical protein